MRLLVGLGNPGRRYAHTRHNVGFDILDVFAKRHHTRINRRMSRSVVGLAVIDGVEIWLAKPQTFMNNSGDTVFELCRRLHLDPRQIIVVYDDMDLPLGKLRIRPGGSAGGHKGMKSIIARLGTDDFPRVRIGIGREDGDTVDYVLSRFDRNELPIIRAAMDRAVEVLDSLIVEGIEAAMNEFN